MYTYSELKEVVEKALKNLSCNTEAPRLIDPVRYIISIGGKRLRPVMTLMACNLFSDKIDKAILPAAGIEVFHNFTLVHDDIMDQSPVRRGVPVVHQKWNVNQAILSGDVMAFIANDCFLQAPAESLLKVFRIFNKAAIEVCVGQQLDMDFEKSVIVSQEAYIRMIELKTAVLLAASLKMGAVIGNADDKDSDLLYDFGRNLGLAFQIQDDILDIWGDSKTFGKKQGGDIVANKKTLPLVKAFENASGRQLERLRKLFSGDKADPETKIAKAMEIYDDLNIRNITEEIASDYINKAFTLLDKVNIDGKRKKELASAAGSLIGRDR